MINYKFSHIQNSAFFTYPHIYRIVRSAAAKLTSLSVSQKEMYSLKVTVRLLVVMSVITMFPIKGEIFLTGAF